MGDFATTVSNDASLDASSVAARLSGTAGIVAGGDMSMSAGGGAHLWCDARQLVDDGFDRGELGMHCRPLGAADSRIELAVHEHQFRRCRRWQRTGLGLFAKGVLQTEGCSELVSRDGRRGGRRLRRRGRGARRPPRP